MTQQDQTNLNRDDSTPAVLGEPLQHVRRLWAMPAVLSAAAALVFTGAAVLGVTAAPVGADMTCSADSCFVDGGVPTPLGPVTVMVSAEGVVTVTLTPDAPNTEVRGLPITRPPAPIFPGFTRTSITTDAGIVNVDTMISAPDEANRPNIAIITIHPLVPIHPPVPVRVATAGTTVVFTPMYPPGPPVRTS